MPATPYLWGGLRVMRGALSPGSLVALVSVYQWLQPAVFGYQDIFLSARRVLVHVGRVREILFPVPARGGTACPPPPLGTEVRNVSFSYDGKRKVLDGLSLVIPAGRITAIVGPSGCGKSTLADLLLGLRTPDAGEILLGSEPLHRVHPGWLRRHVLAVAQEVQLRSGTLQENLLYGSPEASDRELAEAIKIAGLEGWIRTLPDGLETRVGEQGLQVSGGERQRISLAQAVLRRPAVLILDEATSALDALTERRVLARLRKRLPGRTLILFAHRVSVVVHADFIYVLQDGRVAEAGTHADLMRARGLYAALYTAQSQQGG